MIYKYNLNKHPTVHLHSIRDSEKMRWEFLNRPGKNSHTDDQPTKKGISAITSNYLMLLMIRGAEGQN